MNLADSRVQCSSPIALAGQNALAPPLYNPTTKPTLCSCPNGQFLESAGDSACTSSCPTGTAGTQEDVCRPCTVHPDTQRHGNVDGHCDDCTTGVDPLSKLFGVPSACRRCKPGYWLKEKQGCVANCSLDVDGRQDPGFRGYTDASNVAKCERCVDTVNCLECTHDAGRCTLCTNSYSLFEGQCLDTCPFELAPGSSLTDAQPQYVKLWVQSGGTIDSATGARTGAVCVQQIAADTTRPTTMLTVVPDKLVTNKPLFLLQVAFQDEQSKTVTGLTLSELVISPPNLVAPLFTEMQIVDKGASMLFEFQNDGVVTFGVPAGVAADESNNPNEAAANLSIVLDRGRPLLRFEKFERREFPGSRQGVEGIVEEVVFKVSDERSAVNVTGFSDTNLVLKAASRNTLVSIDTVECNQTDQKCRIHLFHRATSVQLYLLEIMADSFFDTAGNGNAATTSELRVQWVNFPDTVTTSINAPDFFGPPVEEVANVPSVQYDVEGLPCGIKLMDKTHQLTGKTVSPNVYNFTVWVLNGNQRVTRVNDKSFTLIVSDCESFASCNGGTCVDLIKVS